MLVFVDESGDAGLKIEAGSSRYFILTTVVFPDRNIAQGCDDAIAELRQTLGLKREKEFHFNKDNDRIKAAFFELVGGIDFWYSAVAVNKADLIEQGFQRKDSLYNHAVSLAFQNIFENLDDAIVVFDRCGGREFTSQLRTYLRQEMNEKAGSANHGKLKKIKDGRSSSNNLLQLADMVCGALARSLISTNGNSEHGRYRQQIVHREDKVQIWPNP